MSEAQLKPCPFCGCELIIGKQRIASCKTEGCAVQHRGVDLDYPKHVAAWNRRTPDPAQIRADALSDAGYGSTRALLDTPLSPTAVDNSPAPDAGMKGQKP